MQKKKRKRKTRRHVWNVAANYVAAIKQSHANTGGDRYRYRNRKPREETRMHVRVHIYQASRSSAILADACIKAGVTAASSLDQSRFSLVRRFFLFFFISFTLSPLFFVHPATLIPHQSVEHRMLTGSRLVGSRSRALQLRRGMHARSANPVLGEQPLLPRRQPTFFAAGSQFATSVNSIDPLSSVLATPDRFWFLSQIYQRLDVRLDERRIKDLRCCVRSMMEVQPLAPRCSVIYIERGTGPQYKMRAKFDPDG